MRTIIATAGFAIRPRLRRFGPATALAAAALAASILAAPVALARSEQQIQSDCQANGGVYSTRVAANGNRVSQCCYGVGNRSTVAPITCSYYVNGEYDGDFSFAQPPGTTASPPPAPPPGATGPIDNPPVAVNPPGGNPPPEATTPPADSTPGVLQLP
jgi:hypothetical protein